MRRKGRRDGSSRDRRDDKSLGQPKSVAFGPMTGRRYIDSRKDGELWNELSWGQLGRSPDLLAP